MSVEKLSDTLNKFSKVNLCTKTLHKTIAIRDGVIWPYLCSKDCPLSIEHLMNHYSLSKRKVTKVLTELIRMGAVHKISISCSLTNKKKFLYIANPETYFHSV